MPSACGNSPASSPNSDTGTRCRPYFVYIDENLLGTWTAFDALPNYSGRASQIASQILGAVGQNVTLPVAVNGEKKSEKTIEIYNSSNVLTLPDATGHDNKMAGVAGLEPVTSAVTGQRSNQLSYTPAKGDVTIKNLFHIVKFWFGFLKAAGRQNGRLENPGSRRQGGGGGEPR